ncbi:MAG: amidohydrolase [Vicinamibacterales bacterium]
MTRFAAAAILAVCVPLAGAAQTADAIYHNGRVVTVNDRFDVVQAIAVKDGRIQAVGTSDAVRALAGPDTRIVDLGGRTLLPGFSDNHIHLGEELQPWKGGMIGAVPEWLRGAGDVEALVEALRRQASRTPAGEWIRGEIAREDWGNQRVPTRRHLDRAAPDHPVAIARGPHTLLLNSAALAKAGITRETPNPPGGWIFRDDKGEPTGRVLEAARRMVTRVMPPEPRTGGDEARLALYRTQLAQIAAMGITSINVASVRPGDFRLIQRLYARWGEELPRATLQLRLSPGHDTYDDPEEGVRVSIHEMEALGVHTGFGNDRLKIGAIKMSIDGGLSAPVFWSLKPYKGRPGFFGAQRIPTEAFYRVAKRAHELGWQTGTHVMGDAAVVMVVDKLEKILRAQPRADHRHYLHHVAVLPPEATLEKMARLGIGVASQPGFTVGLGAYAEEALDPDREATQNPTKSLLDRGIRVSYGSDGGPYGPLVALYAAVTRRGWDDKVRGASEAVDIRTAIRLHTLEPAYMTFDEKTRGSVDVGKAADFVVLGADILTIDPLRLREVPIERTIVGGREIHAAPSPASQP